MSIINYCCYFAPGRWARYCDQRVCLSVCPLAYLKNHMSKLHEIFNTCYPWPPWFYPPPTTLQYVMYFQFRGQLVTPRGDECSRPPEVLCRHYALLVALARA